MKTLLIIQWLWVISIYIKKHEDVPVRLFANIFWEMCFFLFQKHSILSDCILKYKNNCATKLTLCTGFLTSQHDLITIVLIENQTIVWKCACGLILMFHCLAYKRTWHWWFVPLCFGFSCSFKGYLRYLTCKYCSEKHLHSKFTFYY